VRRLLGDRPSGSDPGRVDGPREEPAGRPDVAPREDEHVDDLAELVERPVQVAPLAGDLHLGLVDLPAISNTMSARPSSSTSSGVDRCTPRETVTWSPSQLISHPGSMRAFVACRRQDEQGSIRTPTPTP